MAHAHAATLPRLQLQLDAKRIIATSGVIALHVGVLMMLMMPMRPAQTEPETEVMSEPLVPDHIRLPPPPPPPPPEQPRQHPATTQTVAQVPITDPPADPVDDSVGALDTQAAVDTGPSNTFDAQAEVSPFVQLVPTIAPAPAYPTMAIKRHLTGTVTLRIHVDASGNPIEVLVETSSGSVLLDQAALKTVKTRWHFVPAMSGGVPVEAWALLPVEFVL